MGHAIDISRWQGTPDFDALRSDLDLDCVGAQATNGQGGFDPQFARTWAETKRVGLRRLAYHFAYPAGPNNVDDAVAQARHFFATVQAQGLIPSDLFALDLEVPGGSEMWASAFINELRHLMDACGVAFDEPQPGFYSDVSYINDTVNAGRNIGSSCWLWVAAYQSTPPRCPAGWSSYLWWQDSSNGHEPGIAGDVDEDAETNPFPQSTLAALFLPPIFLGVTMTPQLFVRACYLFILHREPESVEHEQPFIDLYNAKGADAVLSAIADSPEGQTRLAQTRALLDAQHIAKP